jgi:hypothetical protein
MRRVAKLLETRNPDEAARLRMAWQRSRDDRNLDIVDEIENLLKEEYFPEAFEKQKQLETALLRLLDILLDRDAERKDLQEEIKKTEENLESLNRIITEERNQYHESEKFANPEKVLQRAQAALAKMRNLINRQQKVIDNTKGPTDNEAAKGLAQRVNDLLKDQMNLRGKGDAAAQAALAQRAEQLAKDLAQHAQGLPDAMKKNVPGRANPADQAANAAARAAGGMKDAAAKMQGGGEFQPTQQDAEQDLREAADALKRLEDRWKKHGQEQLADDQERVRKDAERLQKDLERLESGAPGNDSGAGNMGKAQGKMEKAEQGLSKGQRDAALPHEEEAKKELEEAYKKLQDFEKELKRLIELPDYDKLAKKQDDTTEKTEDLLKKMKQAGEQPGGESGEPSPGQQGVEGAKKAMQRASRNLRGKSAKGANSDQKEALERLEKAREELEEALRQLREEEQLMLLEALERRLGRMLQKQTKLFKETLSLNNRLKDVSGKPPRAIVDKGRQLGDGETELAVDAEKVLEILREEGTTVVIPDVVDDMKQDLDGLAQRLTKLQCGAYTQQVQRDIMETLRELIEVIKEELNRKQGGKQQGGGDGQEGDQDDNLLPTSAELKMLKSLQVRVNRRTSNYDRLREKEDTERERIADKQSSTATLTRTMADRLNRQEDE